MPDISSMVAVAGLQEPGVVDLARQAEQFLAGHRWCLSISESYLAWELAPQIGVFFFWMIPAQGGVDNELWVIVGDLPPAYIVCDNAQTWQEALDAYGVEMMKWIEAVRQGRSVSEIIPVNVEPTIEYADMLEWRINFIWDKIIDAPPGAV